MPVRRSQRPSAHRRREMAATWRPPAVTAPGFRLPGRRRNGMARPVAAGIPLAGGLELFIERDALCQVGDVHTSSLSFASQRSAERAGGCGLLPGRLAPPTAQLPVFHGSQRSVVPGLLPVVISPLRRHGGLEARLSPSPRLARSCGLTPPRAARYRIGSLRTGISRVCLLPPCSRAAAQSRTPEGQGAVFIGLVVEERGRSAGPGWALWCGVDE